MEPLGEGSKTSPLLTSCLLPHPYLAHLPLPNLAHNPFPKMATYNWDTSQHDFPFSLDVCKCFLHPSPRMCTSLQALGQLGEVLAE